MSDNNETKPKVQIGTATLSIQGLITVALAYGIASVCDHFFHTHTWEHVLQALTPSSHALLLGLVLTPVYLVMSELVPVFRERVLHLPTETVNNFTKPTSTFGYVVRSVATGVSEEILFRGVLQGIAGLWLASAIFAVLHITSKKALPYAASVFFYGLFLGAIYSYTGNLWVTIVIHVINNFVSYHPVIRRQVDRLIPAR